MSPLPFMGRDCFTGLEEKKDRALLPCRIRKTQLPSLANPITLGAERSHNSREGEMADDTLKEMALDYHRYPKPRKLEITATKQLANQRDLALAYSPGVAAACELIADDPAEAATLTARQNLVAVITNGSAVLGLGDIGALASKPVMEGKAVLFKKFAGIDVFDIELDEKDPEKIVDIVTALEPTFGAVNLEDIKAPECFLVEEKCRERMNIPVFHDDQHGTAIVAGAAILNGTRVIGKALDEIKLVSTGGGAAGIACLNLLVSLGVRKENITLVDHVGVVYGGREEEMNPHKAVYAQDTEARTLDEVIDDADVFLGLSAPGILKKDMVERMAERPFILALANPVPEILPDDAKAANPNAVIATGRSDFPNQVNNVLCFPFIFRGALDVGATTINEEMKVAAVRAIADLAMAESSEVVANAYKEEDLKFGADYLIPKPFDLRLIVEIAPAVANRIEQLGLRIRAGKDFSLTNPEHDPRYEEYWRGYHEIMERDGVSPETARTIIRTNTTVISAMMLKRGEADAMICGTYGHYDWHLRHVLEVIGKAKGVNDISAMSTLILRRGTFFLCDTQVTHDPTAEEIAEMTELCADAVRRFGMTPKVALLSHSNFGARNTSSAVKMRILLINPC